MNQLIRGVLTLGFGINAKVRLGSVGQDKYPGAVVAVGFNAVHQLRLSAFGLG